MNLSDYTQSQLHQLDARITKEIGKRQAASRLDLLKRMQALAQEAGLSLDDLRLELNGARPADSTTGDAPRRVSAPKKAPLPAKYRNPNNLNISWSGRGRRPAWIAAWLANGGTLDGLANAAEKFNARSAVAG